MPQCKATRKDGHNCTAQAQAVRDFCFLHDPEKREEVRAAKAKSGSVGGHTTLTQSNLKPWRGTAGEVTVFKSPTVAEVVNLLPLGQDMTDFFTGEATKKTVTV